MTKRARGNESGKEAEPGEVGGDSRAGAQWGLQVFSIQNKLARCKNVSQILDTMQGNESGSVVVAALEQAAECWQGTTDDFQVVHHVGLFLPEPSSCRRWTK